MESRDRKSTPVRTLVLLAALALAPACTEAPASSVDSTPELGAADLTPRADAGPAPDLHPLVPELLFYTRSSPEAPWTATKRSFWGDEVAVRLRGLPPGEVTVSASTGPYRAAATFRATADGTLDLSTTAPLSGSYSGVDADGLFWSAVKRSDAVGLADYPIAFTAEAGGKQLAAATLDRYWAPDGATVVQVKEQGLVGIFVAPKGAAARPALLAFGGSEGGLQSGQLLATYYASLGYSCLGLAYFGEPGLPQQLSKIPLEYFATALAWLKQRPEVDPARVGVMGGSRGGELALLLGASYADVKAVVATVPSGLIWAAAIAADPLPSAWTQGGKELPYVPQSGVMPTVTTDASGQKIFIEAPMFLGDVKAASPDALDAATIRVEKTNGPVLLLAGADDQLWASCTLAAVAFDRLKSTGHQATHADDFQCYPEAGHSLGTPGIPTTGSDKYYMTDYKMWMALGGTPAGTARAARESDTRIRRFLEKSLAGKP